MDPKRLYKFGKTSFENILDRFSLENHYKRNWRNTPLSLHYDIKPLWSVWVTKREATLAEAWFKKNYPPNFQVVTVYNGIKECREWDPAVSFQFQSLLDQKYPKDAAYWERVKVLTESGEIWRDYLKIYYIMLTKKVEL